MLELRNQQVQFFNAILGASAGEEVLAGCVNGDGHDLAHRIDVYRRSIVGNLVRALHATYPVVAKIVGEAFFKALSRAYVRAHPSQSGDLNEYGFQFAQFVSEWPHARDLAYLPDVASMEWLVQQAYYATNFEPDLTTLGECSPERYGELLFEFHPAFSRMDSQWPLDAIWRVNSERYEDDMTVDFTQGAKLVISRRDEMVHVDALTSAQATFIDALVSKLSLSEATEKACVVDPNFDLSACLSQSVSHGYVARVYLKEAI